MCNLGVAQMLKLLSLHYILEIKLSVDSLKTSFLWLHHYSMRSSVQHIISRLSISVSRGRCKSEMTSLAEGQIPISYLRSIQACPSASCYCRVIALFCPTHNRRNVISAARRRREGGYSHLSKVSPRFLVSIQG